MRPSDLSAARQATERAEWASAFRLFSAADATVPLTADDLERWALSSYMLGQQGEYEALLDRAHQRYLDVGDRQRAAYCVCWLGLSLLGGGARAQGAGWFARGARLVAGLEVEGAVHGLLDLGAALTAASEQRFDDALALADRSLDLGLRYGDDDLAALALQVLGRVELRRGNTARGLTLLDEAMVSVTSGALTPPVAGIVYCSVIDGCRTVHALDRAHEWTDALTRWCERQPEMIAFTGECRVLRAEMLQFTGRWRAAVTEAERATQRLSPWSASRVTSAAHYQRAEVARLSGRFDEAERAYEAAGIAGGNPQPGLALLRLVRGDTEHAGSDLAAALAATEDPARRAGLLPAVVEVALADGRTTDARAAAVELADLAAAFRAPVLVALARYAAATVDLADGDVPGALAAARGAVASWHDLGSPYRLARSHVLLGRVYRSLGDTDGAAAAFEAARVAFEALDAVPDLEALRGVSSGAASPFGLSPRELEVLVGLASGKTNRSIGRELGISERTVDRHVSNLFDKLGVTSRAEAAALAVRQRLV